LLQFNEYGAFFQLPTERKKYTDIWRQVFGVRSTNSSRLYRHKNGSRIFRHNGAVMAMMVFILTQQWPPALQKL